MVCLDADKHHSTLAAQCMRLHGCEGGAWFKSPMFLRQSQCLGHSRQGLLRLGWTAAVDISFANMHSLYIAIPNLHRNGMYGADCITCTQHSDVVVLGNGYKSHWSTTIFYI